MRPGAFFDLDGTLVRGTSVERLLVPWLARQRVIGPRQLAAAAALAATWPLLGRTRALRRNKRWLTGVEVAAVESRVQAFLDKEVAPRWCRPVLAMMEELRSSGHALVLVSGAPDFIVRAVAERFRADGWSATPMQIAGTRFTGRLGGSHVYGRQKVESLHRLADELDLDLRHSWGFADHPSDVDFLNGVANKVVVDPSRGLRRIARRGGWRVIESV